MAALPVPSGRRKSAGTELRCRLGTYVSAADTKPALVRDVSNRKQLFIDDRFIASSTNVRLVVNPPKLAGPALEPGPPGSWDDAKVTWG